MSSISALRFVRMISIVYMLRIILMTWPTRFLTGFWEARRVHLLVYTGGGKSRMKSILSTWGKPHGRAFLVLITFCASLSSLKLFLRVYFCIRCEVIRRDFVFSSRLDRAFHHAPRLLERIPFAFHYSFFGIFSLFSD